ncbi:MAG: hypothetical protein IT365_12020 [Candidatus Hydrogenedentes bacterium]|nr:hypothetical protein [Candidatus Hydrogenedentota bacterium]
MSKIVHLMAGVALVAVTSLAFAEVFAIPADQIDPKKVYWGEAAGFEKAGEVDYDSVVKATPEYKELKKKKIERGTGKYWILMSQASDRSARAIAQVGQDTEYDLIAAQGYLGSLKPAIPAEDITKLILKQLEQSLTKGESLAKGEK